MKNLNPTVFIVDDEPVITEMLSDYLKEKYGGFKIRSFETGEACLKNLHKKPDAVVLDYYLNTREKEAANGIDILREIKNRDKNLPVIMLSAQESYGTATQTIRFGAIHYVMKGRDAYQEIFELLKSNV